MNSLVGQIFISKSSGMEVKIIGESEDYIIAYYKGCVPFAQKKVDFMKLYQELKSGEGINSFYESAPIGN